MTRYEDLSNKIEANLAKLRCDDSAIEAESPEARQLRHETRDLLLERNGLTIGEAQEEVK